MRKNWTIRLATFALWLLAVGGGVFWALKFVRTSAAPANVAVVSSAPSTAVDSAALVRVLGGGLAAASPVVAAAGPAPDPGINASKFALTGIVAGKFASQGIALIAVDGKPARPYRVGAQVTEGVVLKSVVARQAVLAPSRNAPPSVTLELPKPATSSLAVAKPAVPSALPIPPAVSPAPVVTPPPANPVLADPAAALPVPAQRPGTGRQRALREAGRDFGRDAPREDQPAAAGAVSQ